MYEGDDLPTLFDQTPATLTLRRMAHTGGSHLKARVEENTPIDSGDLRKSWKQGPVKHRRVTMLGAEDVYESEVTTDKDYADDVEHGTGLWGPEHRKYLIEPKKPGGLLSWIDASTGHRVFARRVWHPGSPGQHMMAFGAAKTEATMTNFLAPDVEFWVAEQTKQFAVARARRH